ncbi:uncharacterized protein [Rutidosis leptorrhynchoides]|uniref:uncharacterized protein isoform X2 n=1 Tax=Rutidosis leptorrhynchoides TaxID=125765 RepID=UPI003A99AF40
MGQKGYKLFDIKSEKKCVSMNVTFVEDKFPFDVKYEGHKTLEKEHLYEFLPQIQSMCDDHIVNSEEHQSNESENIIDVAPPQSGEPNDQSGVQTSSINDHMGTTTDEHVNINMRGENLRMSTRTKTKPKHLSEYITKLPPSLEHDHPIPNSDSSTSNTAMRPSHPMMSQNF